MIIHDGGLNTAADVATALGVSFNGRAFVARCPSHQDAKPSLSVDERDGRLLLHCFSGCSFRQVIEALGSRSKSGYRSVTEMVPHERRPCEQDKVNAIWNQSSTVQHRDPVFRYLTEARGLALAHIPESIRYHQNLPYWIQTDAGPECHGEHPAMVAAVHSSTGMLVGVHRTYLTAEGCKLVIGDEPCRKLKTAFPGATKGGAIRLYPPGDVLAISEGIESGFGAYLLSGIPVWAAISAGGMEAVQIPDTVREVLICGDCDPPTEQFPLGRGKSAAQRLAGRLMREGKTVKLAIPERRLDRKSTDWADMVGVEQ